MACGFVCVYLFVWGCACCLCWVLRVFICEFGICTDIGCCLMLIEVGGCLRFVNCLPFACGICYVMTGLGFVCMVVYV